MRDRDKQATRYKILNDEDFVHCPRLGNSLSKLIDRYPDGISDDRICKVLLIEKSELKKIYARAIKKLRKSIL